MITDFHELNKPHLGIIPHLGIMGNKWFVCIKGHSPYYLKNDGSKELEALVQIQSHFCFDSEHLAHKAACSYYSHFGKLYPYHDEYAAGFWAEQSKKKQAKNNESQHMVFK